MPWLSAGFYQAAWPSSSLLGHDRARLTRRRWQVIRLATARHARPGWRDLLSGKLLARPGPDPRPGRSHAARPTKGQALRSLLSPRVPSEWAVRLCSAAFLGSRRAGDFIRINDFVHLATFAPAGGGKSVSVLVPNLLSYDGNCVVIDPKGELFKLTAEHRQKQFGHTIVRLDPARLYGPGADSFNPFDWIDPKRPDFIDVCRDLANMLVVRTGKEMDPHWCDSAENVICAFIAYICALEGNPAARNLRGVRAQIASRENYARALEVMQQHDGFYGVLEELGHSLTWHVDKELGSRHDACPAVHQHLRRSAGRRMHRLDAASIRCELRTGRMTVYLITPADKMVVWAGLQRLWLGCLLRIITQGVPTEKNPVLFLVDECCPYRQDAGAGRCRDAHAGHGHPAVAVFPVDRAAEKMLRRQRRNGARQPGDATVFLDHFLRNRRGDVQADRRRNHRHPDRGR